MEWLLTIREPPAVGAALGRATVPHPERVFAPGPETSRWG